VAQLGVAFVARQVPAERADREGRRRKTASEEIPTLLLEGGTAISGADEIIEYLEAKHHERADAEEHRERAEAHS